MKIMHFITRSDGQGSHSAGTACGLEVSNWKDDPKHDITFTEIKVTCTECMPAVIEYLRTNLTRSCSIDERWWRNSMRLRRVLDEAKKVWEDNKEQGFYDFVEKLSKEEAL